MATEWWSMALIVASTLVSATASYLFKRASGSKGLALITNINFLAGGFLYVLSAITAIIAYRGGELTVLVPLGSLNYIWGSIIAVWLLNEKMNKWKWGGIALIMLGIMVIGIFA